jgi:hypothetical protein
MGPYRYCPHECVPVNGPSDYSPWWSGSREMAERLKHTLEHEYRNRYSFKLVVEDDKPRVVFSYPPSYLFNFEIRRSPDASPQ